MHDVEASSAAGEKKGGTSFSDLLVKSVLATLWFIRRSKWPNISPCASHPPFANRQWRYTRMVSDMLVSVVIVIGVNNVRDCNKVSQGTRINQGPKQAQKRDRGQSHHQIDGLPCKLV